MKSLQPYEVSDRRFYKVFGLPLLVFAAVVLWGWLLPTKTAEEESKVQYDIYLLFWVATSLGYWQWWSSFLSKEFGHIEPPKNVKNTVETELGKIDKVFWLYPAATPLLMAFDSIGLLTKVVTTLCALHVVVITSKGLNLYQWEYQKAVGYVHGLVEQIATRSMEIAHKHSLMLAATPEDGQHILVVCKMPVKSRTYLYYPYNYALVKHIGGKHFRIVYTTNNMKVDVGNIVSHGYWWDPKWEFVSLKLPKTFSSQLLTLYAEAESKKVS